MITSMGGSPSSAPTTRTWAVLLEHPDRASEDFCCRVGEFLRRHWKPIHLFVRHGRANDTEDAKEEFLAKILQEDLIGTVAPQKRPFRTFLKTALRNHLVDEAAFDRAWAQDLLEKAAEEVRKQLKETQRAVYLDVYDAYVLTPERPSYKDLALRFGVSERDVSRYLATVRREIRRALRQMIGEYCVEDEDVFQEMHTLFSK